MNMFLTVKQKILVILLGKGSLQNSDIAKRVGLTEQWCSEMINALHAEGLIESQFITPRRINKLTVMINRLGAIPRFHPALPLHLCEAPT